MIKFPATLREYTNGDLWYKGIDNSIAQRILARYDCVQNENEKNERKMYIAHYFCNIGEYSFAVEIINELLLEGVFVEEAINLLRKLSIEDQSIDNFERIIRFASDGVDEAMQDWLFDGMMTKLPKSLAKDFRVGKDGYVISTNGRDYYYKNGKLSFSVSNRDYGAYISEMSARFYINAGQYEKALAVLQNTDFDRTTVEVRNMCYKSYVEIYCEMKEYDKAYEYCLRLIERDVYTPYIADVFYSMYLDGNPQAEIIKEFFMKHKGYEIIDLCDMHSLSSEMANGEEFWRNVLSNNPISADDTSENAIWLRGMLHFNAGEYELAKRDFAQLVNACGSFGKGELMLKYLEYFEKNMQKVGRKEDMPDKIYSVQFDWISDFVGKKLNKKLKKITTAEEFMQDCDDNVLGLKTVLYSAQSRMTGVFDLVDRLYSTGCMTVRDTLNRIVGSGEYNIFVRAICLAEYLLHTKNETVVVLGGEYENFVGKLKKDDKKKNFVYGIALFCGLTMLTGFDKEEIKSQVALFRKVCETVDLDYSQVNPCTVFSLLFSYASESKKLSFVGVMTKKSDVCDLIGDLYASLYPDSLDSDEYEKMDEEVSNFIVKCGFYLV